jgi:uncharacterized protein (TIGR02246 family)
MTRQQLSAIGSVALAALLATSVATARREAPAPDKDLRAPADAFAAAWNRDDVKGMAAQWAEDGDIINPFGHAAKGRTEIEAFFQQERGTMTKGTTFKVTAFAARMLRPDLALEDFDVQITGGTMAPDPAKPLEHHVFAVAKRQGARWYWVALRAYRSAPPPPAAPAKP